jgi:ribosome-interacting GTPase 1
MVYMLLMHAYSSYTRLIGSSIDLSLQMQVISTSRTCNCILIVLDAIKPITHKRLIEKELEGFGIR